jgi:RecA-family ATPase
MHSADIEYLRRKYAPEAVNGDDWQPPMEYPENADNEPARELEAPAQAPEPLALVSPAAWRGKPLPDMRWLATNRIPSADATILSGDGGGGKTTVALQLAVSVEAGLGDWLGAVCESGPVIFFSGEEPEPEMRRRLGRVTRKRGLEPDELKNLHFHFAEPDNCLLAVARRSDGLMVPTPLLSSLAQAAIEIKPALIVVDSIAATFGGNQNDRVHARTFISMFRSIAREADCSVLLLDHPSLSGITSGTGRGGSMDWQNATRARLHLDSVTDEDGTGGRVLEVKKLNYGPTGEKVKLRWEEGCYVLQGTEPAPAQAAAFNSADETYLVCLDSITAQGRRVSDSPSATYAPAIFADMPDARGITARGFKAAQDRLFSSGMIHIVTEGSASKRRRRIARKMSEAES